MRWWCVCAFLAHAGGASADPDPVAARAAVAEAEKLAAAGNYTEAAAKFLAAHALDQRAEYLCNVGVAYQRAKELPRAQIYLGDCLRRGTTLDGKFIELVRNALGTVEEKLRAGEFTPVDLIVEPAGASWTLSLFGTESFVGSRVLWVPFGKHQLTITADGYVPQTRELDLVTRSQRQLRVDLVKPAVEPVKPTPPAPIVVAPPPAIPPPAPRSKLPAILATSATVVVAGAALGTLFKARSVMSGAESTTLTRPAYDAIVDDARGWQHVSWVLAGAAGAGAVVGGLLWYRATRPVLEVTPHGVSLAGRW